MKIHTLFISLIFLGGLSMEAHGSAVNVSEVNYNILPDSLSSRLKNLNRKDKTYAETLFASVEYIQRNQKEYNYVDYIHEIQKWIDGNEDNYLICYAYYLIGGYYLNFYNAELVSLYLNLALSKSKLLKNNLKDNTLCIKIQLALSAYHYNISDLPKALEALQKVQQLNKVVKDEQYNIFYQNNLAVTYEALGDNKSAIKILKEILARKHLELELLQVTCANIGSCYLNMGNADSSILYLTKAIEITNKNTRNYSASNTYSLLGQAYGLRNKHDIAIYFLFLGKESAMKYEEEDVLTKIYINSAKLYLKTGQIAKALENVNEGIEKATKNGILSSVTEGTKLKSDIYYKMGDLGQAYRYLVKHEEFANELNAKMNATQSNFMLLQNDFNLKQQELEFAFKESELKIQKQRLMLSLLLIVFVFGFSVVMLLFKKKSLDLKNKKITEESLRNDLELKNKELASNVMFQMNKKELLDEIILDLQTLKKDLAERNQIKINPLISRLQKTVNKDIWSDFEYSFKQIHQSFYDHLLKDFPDLSLSEKKICAFVKLNLTTKEISSITNLDPNSIRVSRVRLRKKLGLTNETQSLNSFLAKY